MSVHFQRHIVFYAPSAIDLLPLGPTPVPEARTSFFNMNIVEFQNDLWNLFLVEGLEYPAVVEFAPFQKIAKKKLKKKDAKTKRVGNDPEYKELLETYFVEEEKTSANPKTLLGDMEAKTELTSLFCLFLPFTSLSVFVGNRRGVSSPFLGGLFLLSEGGEPSMTSR